MNKKWISPARLLLLGTALAGAVSFSSCDDDNDEQVNNMYTISGNGSSSLVVPPFTGTGTGTITGTFDKSTNMLNYNIGWTGLTDTASNVGFYSGATGVSGNSAQNLAVSVQGMTGSATGTLTLTDQQESDLLNGNWYYSVGTLANSTGEVRGQVTAAQ